MRLLDLYGGSGALSLAFAKDGAKVALVESFRRAADSAARAAEEQGISHLRDSRRGRGRGAGRLSNGRLTFDAVFANPPRRGMAPDVRKALSALRPRAITYVSCEPDSLARDLAHLARLGYATERLHPVDMIPLTDQVETVAMLTPARTAPSAVAHEDVDVRVIEKHAHVTPDSAQEGELRLAWSASEDESGFAVWCQQGALPHLAPRQVCLVLARGIMAARGRIGKRATYARLAKLNGHSFSVLRWNEETRPTFGATSRA